jgi:hypothetical protein
MRSHLLARALLQFLDQKVSVSVDLSNGEDSTSGNRAFGEPCEIIFDGEGGLAILGECGRLNFDPRAK